MSANGSANSGKKIAYSHQDNLPIRRFDQKNSDANWSTFPVSKSYPQSQRWDGSGLISLQTGQLFIGLDPAWESLFYAARGGVAAKLYHRPAAHFLAIVIFEMRELHTCERPSGVVASPRTPGRALWSMCTVSFVAKSITSKSHSLGYGSAV
jgi:hypothetical protein